MIKIKAGYLLGHTLDLRLDLRKGDFLFLDFLTDRLLDLRKGDFLFFLDFFTDFSGDFLFFIDFRRDLRCDFLLRDLDLTPLHFLFFGHGVISLCVDHKNLHDQ